MSRRRSPRKPLAVSLFPFLAVLICTLGVLIVLLVLATKSAEVQATTDHQALQAQADLQVARLQQLQEQMDETETLVEIISHNRPAALAELNRSREYRGHLEADVQKLRQTIKELDAALASKESFASVEVDVKQKTLQVEALNQEILAAEKKLAAKRKEFQANSKVAYSIVPHEGSGGTFRRPIFLESRADSIVIQPLGIKLTKEDFAPPLGPGNPLDAAVLAIREYWQAHQGDQQEGSPYPLMVIRPDGAEGYAIFRRALASWEDEFGYELVEADKELDFGPVDSQLKAAVETAIAEAKVRQQRMLAARPIQQPAIIHQAGFNRGRGGYVREIDQRPGLTVSGSGGGFVVNSGWEEFYNQRESLGEGAFSAGSGELEGRGEQGAGQDDSATGWGTRQGKSGNNNFQASSSSSLRAGNTDSLSRSNGQQAGEFQQSGGTDPPGEGPGQVAEGAGTTVGSGSAGSANTAGTGNLGNAQQSADPSCPDGKCSPPMMYQHMSMAKTRGRDWAVPNKTKGATAYVRPIRIVCTATELEVMSPLGVEKRIPLNGSLESAIDPLVNEIWRQIESWGISGERSYWKPELRMSVVAGGENNFEKLQGLLFESGVQVKESGQ